MGAPGKRAISMKAPCVVRPVEEGGFYDALGVDADDELLDRVGFAFAPGVGGAAAIGLGEVGASVGVGVVDDSRGLLAGGVVEAAVEFLEVGLGEDVGGLGGSVGGGGVSAGGLVVDAGAGEGHARAVARPRRASRSIRRGRRRGRGGRPPLGRRRGIVRGVGRSVIAGLGA